jgi:hypothetical protein
VGPAGTLGAFAAGFAGATLGAFAAGFAGATLGAFAAGFAGATLGAFAAGFAGATLGAFARGLATGVTPSRCINAAKSRSSALARSGGVGPGASLRGGFMRASGSFAQSVRAR